MVPRLNEFRHLSPQDMAQVLLSDAKPRRNARRAAQPPERLATDAIVRALLVREHEGDVVLEAAAQARHVQDDGRGGRLERASVKVARLERISSNQWQSVAISGNQFQGCTPGARPLGPTQWGPIQWHSAVIYRTQWPFGPIAINESDGFISDGFISDGFISDGFISDSCLTVEIAPGAAAEAPSAAAYRVTDTAH